MTPTLWIALGFVAGLVVFLMLTYLLPDRSTPNQHKTLRFLTSLCSGFAGGLFTGEALFHFEQQLSTGAKFTISGTAGFALFFVVWFRYGHWTPPQLPLFGRRFKISIPANWTFEQAARVIAERIGTADFQGFQKDELATPMRAVNLDENDEKEALAKLAYSGQTRLPPYRVEMDRSIVHIIKAEMSTMSVSTG